MDIAQIRAPRMALWCPLTLVFLNKAQGHFLDQCLMLGEGSHSFQGLTAQLVFGDAHTQVPMMPTAPFILPQSWLPVFGSPGMTRSSSCEMAGTWSQWRSSQQGSVSPLPGEFLPSPLGLRVLEVGEGAAVDLAVFYGASVYKEPSSLHVLVGNLYALQSSKTRSIRLSSTCEVI